MSKIQRIIATVFLVVGLVLLGVGAYLGLVPAIPEEFTGTTQATITEITTSHSTSTRSGRSNVRHTVLVGYEVDNQAYECALGYYDSGMAVGQAVEIQYDTRNPSTISSPAGRLIGIIICLGLGVVFAVVGVVLQFKPVPVFVNGRRVTP